ncbi:MAG: ribonuclease P protein component [Candidatus Portnoybacteria bacterium CG23_combo_of_CG06-09_8_20_14_all_37_13]|uniref:Ribonuclease P protein component n=1 Tax=Candidatus Portnoybacteria bacterium CG23_combo_of_CG06-09_8_20_14_all_37_13 TaxID=1974819 RepID=A0A2G9YCA0_9BACT|nr:MAG: ribonuclease P protein component [Candidatus Portnoybacteria bacterium CG23_combo_of_CG06-09_8_20_14_all_37_13]
MNSFLYLKYKTNNLNKNQFRIIVSLKVSKKAVVRNKIKRRIREVLRQLDVKQGYDIVVITNKEIVGKSFQEIKKAILCSVKYLI